MMRPTREQDAKINTILSNLEDIQRDWKGTEEDLYSAISDIICQFDTDIAIGVMERLGSVGQDQAIAIKVNYGY